MQKLIKRISAKFNSSSRESYFKILSSVNLQLKQTVFLYLGSIFNIIFGLVASVIVTRNLGPLDYGNYTYLIAIFSIVFQVLNFGLFFSTGRILVQCHNDKRTSQYFAASIILLFLIYLLGVMITILYTLIDSNIENKGLLDIFIILIPFSFIFPSIPFIDSILQGSNKIIDLSITRGGKKLFYLIFLLLFLFYHKLNLNTVLISFYASSMLAIGYVIIRIKPKFSSIRKRFTEILKTNTKYGKHVYIGSLAMVANAKLTPIIISFFGADNVDVGLYSLALVICNPIYLVSNTVATTYFKRFASHYKIPVRLILIVTVISVILLTLTFFFIEPVVLFVYSKDYLDVVPIVYIVAIGVIMHGLGDVFNSFMGAHGKGISLRNVSFITGSILLISNIILIPDYGAIGAGYAKLLASIAYLVSILYSYLRFIRYKPFSD